ncbi:MAG: pantoate--beta-alanine ligase [Sedimentisphaeraceae bacterium JB056]
MKIVKTIDEVRLQVAAAKKNGKKIGFVPTMGALHAGHLSLMNQAKDECGYVIVSIFVNPTQFGPSEDFSSYPRDLSADAEKCKSVGIDLIFAPEVEEMYPVKNRCWVTVEGKLTDSLCGANRPGHFRGVTTVCTKLFNIVQPDIAFFGQKDAQQAAVLKAMVKDTNLPLEVRVCPIIREKSGLAMSSRNDYLSAEERQQASILYKSLCKCEDSYNSGCKNVEKLKETIKSTIAECKIAQPDYIEIVDFETLEPIETVERTALAAIAVKIGPARLIDNVLLK